MNTGVVEMIDSFVTSCVSISAGSDGYGGGFSIWFNAHLILRRTTVSGCEAAGPTGESVYGGVGIVYGSVVDAIDSVFSSCTSGSEAGGLYYGGISRGTITGSTFSDCSARDSGALTLTE